MPKPYFNKENKIEEIIRVNHAGEYGAQQIYEGQLNYIKNTKSKELIKHMLEQELEHLDYFSNQIKKGNSSPTIFMPIWKIASYALGAASAKLGDKTAMLVTENVEMVIIDHYQEQINYLEKLDPNNPLLQKIKKFKQDEADHIHIAIENDSNNAKFYNLLSKLVRTFCHCAIFLSKKI